MELNLFIQIGLPVALALIMFSLGLTIDRSDFAGLRYAPRPVLLGLSAQLLSVPLLAIITIRIFELPPALAAGLMILSFCPGGVTSNWFSHLARANVPLSISLTVIASLITPFSIPLLSELALQNLMQDQRSVHIPPGLTMLRLLMVSVVPVLIGMLIRARLRVISDRWQPVIYRFSSLLFIVVIFAIIIQQWHSLPGLLAQAGAASMAMILSGMLLGGLLGHAFKLGTRDTRTISIEVGMQNGGMALLVTQNVLQSPELSIVPVVYGLIMLLPIYLYSRYAAHQPV